MSTTTNTPPTGGLRAAKREQTAARKASAAKAPAAKKAPAKAPAKKPAADKAARVTIKWSYAGERGKSAQTGVASDGATYKISPAGEKWQAVVTPAGGKPATLATGVGLGAAYTRCVKHAKGETTKAVAA
jgi:hypothetical protein